MADINLTFGTNDLNELKKLLQQISKEIQRIKSADIIGDDEATKAKRLVAEQQKISNEIKKQELYAKSLEDKQERYNRRVKESKGIVGGLEAETRKLRSEIKSATDPNRVKQLNRQLDTTRKKLTEAKGTTAGWGKALGSFQFKFNALGNIAANVIGRLNQQLKQFVRGSFEALDKQLKAEKSLLTALNGRTDVQRRLISQAKELQGSTLFGDEETIKAQALIAAFVKEGDQIERIIPLVQDLAAAKGMDLAAAADLVSKTLGSSTNALSRYGIQVEGAVGSTERLESLANGLTSAFGGQAEAAAGADVTFTQLKNAMGDLQEEIAKLVAPESTQSLISLVDSLTDSVKILGSESLTTGDKIRGLFGGVGAKAAIAATSEALDVAIESTSEYGIEQQKLIEEQQKKAIADENEQKRLKELEQAEIQRIETLRKKLQLRREEREAQEVISKTQKEYIGELRVATDEEIDLMASADMEFIKGEDEKTKKLQEEAEKRKKIEQQESNERKRIAKELFTITSTYTIAFSTLFETQKENELSAVGDNATKRLAIEKEYAKKQQALAIGQALINGAVAATKALKDVPFPASLLISALYAGLVGTQIAEIKQQKFAKGGEVNGPLHSQGGVSAELEGGEYVINKKSTSKYKDLIQGINENDQLKIMMALDKDKAVPKPRHDPYLKRLYELEKNKVNGYETPEYYVIQKGNKTIRLRKE